LQVAKLQSTAVEGFDYTIATNLDHNTITLLHAIFPNISNNSNNTNIVTNDIDIISHHHDAKTYWAAQQTQSAFHFKE